jgi:hypothetical protein
MSQPLKVSRVEEKIPHSGVTFPTARRLLLQQLD